MDSTKVARVGHTDLAGDLGRRVADRLSQRHVEVTDKLDGVATVFIVPVRERADRVQVHEAALHAAVEAGVKHIVYLSFLNTGPSATFTLARDHYATEQHVRASGVAFTFLRASAFQEVAHYLLGPDDVIRGPGGNGRVAFVSKDDVADVAVTVLLNTAGHAGATYSLTGPRAMSLRELAELFTRAAGRPVTYHEETIEEAYASRAELGAPAWEVDAWVSTYQQIAAGELETVTDDIERLLHRRPKSLENYLRDHPDVLTQPT